MTRALQFTPFQILGGGGTVSVTNDGGSPEILVSNLGFLKSLVQQQQFFFVLLLAGWWSLTLLPKGVCTYNQACSGRIRTDITSEYMFNVMFIDYFSHKVPMTAALDSSTIRAISTHFYAMHCARSRHRLE